MRIEEPKPKKTFLTIMHLVQSLWNHLKSFKVKCRKTRNIGLEFHHLRHMVLNWSRTHVVAIF